MNDVKKNLELPSAELEIRKWYFDILALELQKVKKKKKETDKGTRKEKGRKKEKKRRKKRRRKQEVDLS